MSPQTLRQCSISTIPLPMNFSEDDCLLSSLENNEGEEGYNATSMSRESHFRRNVARSLPPSLHPYRSTLGLPRDIGVVLSLIIDLHARSSSNSPSIAARRPRALSASGVYSLLLPCRRGGRNSNGKIDVHVPLWLRSFLARARLMINGG